MPRPRILSYRPTGAAAVRRGKARAAGEAFLWVLGAACLVLFAADVPFLWREDARPAIFIAATQASTAERTFIDRLAAGLRESGVCQPPVFVRGKVSGRDLYLPPGFSTVDLRAGLDSDHTPWTAAGADSRGPRIMLGLNLPRAADAAPQFEQRWKEGALVLQIANPPELEPKPEILHIQPRADGVEIQLVCRYPQKAAPAQAFVISFALRPEAPSRPITARRGREPVEILPGGTNGQWEIRDRLPMAATGAVWSTAYSVSGVSPEDIVAASARWRDDVVVVPLAEPDASHPTRARALVVPLFALSRSEQTGGYELAWRQIVDYIGEDRLLHFVAGAPDTPASGWLSLGLALTGESAAVTVASSGPLRRYLADHQSEDEVARYLPHLADFEELRRDPRAFELVVVDYSLPRGCTATELQTFGEWLSQRADAEVLGPLRQWTNSSPVHVICLGPGAGLCRAGPLAAPVSAMTFRPLTPPAAVRDSPPPAAPQTLLIQYDETESSGNALEYRKARLATLPPVPAAVNLESLLSKAAVRLKEDPAALRLARDYLHWLLAGSDLARQLGQHGQTLDENNIVRRRVETHSKASFLRDVAGQLGLAFEHPFLAVELQGVKLYAAPPATPSVDSPPEADPARLEGYDAVELNAMNYALYKRAEQLTGAARLTPIFLVDGDDMDLNAPLLKRSPDGKTFPGDPKVLAPARGRSRISGLIFAVHQREHGDASAPAEWCRLDDVLREGKQPVMTEFGDRYMLYGGRWRCGQLLGAKVADAMSSVRPSADLTRLRDALSASERRNLLLEDLFATFVSTSWRLTRPADVELTSAEGYQPVTVASTGKDDETKPLVQIVRTRGRGWMAAVLCDCGLERHVADAALSAVSRHFKDWVLPAESYGSPTLTHFLHVESTSAVDVGSLAWNVGEYDAAPDFSPAVPGRPGVAGSYKVIEPGGVAEFEDGNRLVIPHARMGKKDVRKLRVQAPSGLHYWVYLPVTNQAIDQELRLRVPPNVDSVIRILADLLRSAKAVEPGAVAEVGGLSRDAAVDGVAFRNAASREDAADVVLTRLELPIACEAGREGERWVNSTRQWIETRARLIGTSASSRNWLIAGLLCFAMWSGLRNLPRRN